MKVKHLVLVLVFLTNCALAQVKHTVTKSTISFKIKNLGINTDGTISGFQGNIQFDPANLAGSSIEASVDANTITTDNDMRDNHIKSDDYFNVAKYPAITIKSIALKHKSGDNYVGQFNLTIKDRTQVVDIPFSYIASANTASFTGTFKIKRTDFGIGGSSMVMANDVAITIDVETSK